MKMTDITLSGPRISRKIYEVSQRTGRCAKRLSSEMKDIRRHITVVREARRTARNFTDPLIVAGRIRTLRLEIIRRERPSREIRETLLHAARIARAMGFAVRSSNSRDGRISSYYCERLADLRATGRAARIRISDHTIPHTDERDFRAGGTYAGYTGPEIIIDRLRSATWLRRAIALAAAGRDVPGNAA